jgi:hypothetical protein
MSMNQKTPTTRPTTEVIRTHAERMAHEAEERLQKRQLLLAEQCSIANPPDVRIRAWERVHALSLPSDPGHPVLPSIATCTGLTVAQIQDEQIARRARRTASAQTRPPGELV